MSLTSFINIPQIKQKFKEEFPIPTIKLDSPILAPLGTKNYLLVGTAFDYLLRFYIQSIAPKSVDQKWVAEESIERIKLKSGQYASIDGEIKSFDKNKDVHEQFPKAREIFWEKGSKEWAGKIKPSEDVLSEAKDRHAKFVQTGKLDDALIESTLKLAQLDQIYRSGRIDLNNNYLKQDVDELRQLFDVAVQSNVFKENINYILNPTFGKGSELVGGADADLISDDTLIDIKVTKNLKFTQAMYNQIIGYYALSAIENKPPKIKNVGIYFARHGILHTIAIHDIAQKSDLTQIVKWFELIAEYLKKMENN